MGHLAGTGRSMWRGAMILTIAAVVVKILSTVYRLPYQNLAGDVGFYVYQQIYPFYSLAVVMGGTGFPIVISTFIAEAEARKDGDRLQSVFWHAFLAVSLLSLVLFICLLAGAPLLAGLMGDGHLAGIFRMSAFIYLFVPLLSVLRGNFQGRDNNMVPTAVSQVGEQAARVSLILGGSFFFYVHHGTPYQFGAAATFGSVAAPAVSTCILIFFCLKYHALADVTFKGFSFDWPLTKHLLAEGVAFSLLSLSLVAFQFIDALSVLPNLQHFHWLHPKQDSGIYDRAYPLVQFGMTAATALTMSIVPEIAKMAGERKKGEIRRQAALALRVSFVFGAAAAIGLALISPEADHMLFEDESGALSLSLMAFSILTLSMVMTSAGILQAAHRPWIPAAHLLIGMVLKLALNMVLVPIAGITGAALATVIATGVTAWLNLSRIRHDLQVRFFRRGQLAKLSLSLAGMIAVVLVLKTVIYHLPGMADGSRSTASFAALLCAIFGGLGFMAILLKSDFFNASDRESLPFLNKVAQPLKRKNAE